LPHFKCVQVWNRTDHEARIKVLPIEAMAIAQVQVSRLGLRGWAIGSVR
jgi:hypothetical protein